MYLHSPTVRPKYIVRLSGYPLIQDSLTRIPLPPDEHDAFRCLPMNTMTMLFLRSDPAMSTSPHCTYARVGVRDPARMYTYVPVFSFLHPGRCTYVYMLHARLYYDTCAPLHPQVYMYIHVRDQNDNATYASTRWVPTIRHFLACEDVAGGSQRSGENHFIAQMHFLACEDVAGGSQQSGGQIVFFLDALPCVRRCSLWVPAVRGRIIFSRNTVARPVVPRCQVEE